MVAGKTRDMFPMSPKREAQETAYLAGGVDQLASKAKGALEEGDMKWALIFADYALILDHNNTLARDVKNASVISLAGETYNAQARNYLLSEYLEETGQMDSKPILDRGYSSIDENIVTQMPMDTLFRIMAVNLNASKSLNEDYVVGLELTDENVTPNIYKIHIRRGVVEIQPEIPENPAFTISTESLIWKRLAMGQIDPQETIEKGYVVIEGADQEEFTKFMDLFK